MSASEWAPVFAGQRPPFAPGNQVALQHGAYTPRVIEPRAREVVESLLADDDVSFLRQPAYRAALWRYAQRQARADLVYSWLADHAEGCQGCKRCLQLEDRWREFDTAAAKASERLGLDPLSRARLGRDVAAARADTAQLLVQLREAAEGEGGGDDGHE